MIKALAAILTAILFIPSPLYPTGGDVKVVGYYPSWLQYTLPAEKIKFEYLTHISHAFAWPNADGALSAYSDLHYPRLIECAHQYGVKVLIALGGWGQSDGFSAMAASSTARGVFIENILRFCSDWGYDGVDIDWEYPSSTSDTKNLNVLVKELREAMSAQGLPLLLTMAVPAGSWSGQRFDFGTLLQYVDWFGCMTYDFFGSWISRAGHNSPLYPPLQNDNGSVHAAITYLNSNRQVPRNQILAGIPFYGRGCNATGYNQPNTGGNVAYDYSQVVPLIGNGWMYHWDDVAKVPYLMNTASTKFISFDDTTSVRLKCEYAVAADLAGVMIWALGQDVMGETQPLQETVGKVMMEPSAVERIAGQIPGSFVLLNNYPNPFNSHTVITFSIPEDEHVLLEVFNSIGAHVATLLDAEVNAGRHSLPFDASNSPSGVYLYRLRTRSQVRAGKMTVLR